MSKMTLSTWITALVAALVVLAVGGAPLPSSAEPPAPDAPDAIAAVPADRITLVSQFGGPITALAVSGHYVYIGSGLRLLAVDVADPAHPVEAGSITVSGIGITDITLSSEYVYVSTQLQWVQSYPGELHILDARNPATPTPVGVYRPANGSIQSVAAAGRYAYMCGDSGFRVLDVADPTAPVAVGYYVEGCSKGIAVSGNTVFYNWGAGLLAVDVSDPAFPFRAGSVAVGETTYDVAVAAGTAYLAAQSGLRIVDARDPRAMAQVGALPTPSQATDVAVEGGYAYLSGPFGLWIVDVSDPAQPRQVAALAPAKEALQVAVAGGQAYLVENNALRIADVTVPASPVATATYLIPENMGVLAVAGRYLYAAAPPSLCVLDVAVPAAPALVGCYPTPGQIYDIAVAGDYVYLAAWDAGLHIWDMSNPAAPRPLGSYDSPGRAQAVVVVDGIAYLADGDLRAIDVRDPAAPVELGACAAFSREALVVAGRYAYTGERYTQELNIVDIVDPTHMTVVGTFSQLNIGFQAMAVQGGFTYAAASEGHCAPYDSCPGGLVIFNTQNPAAPTLASFMRTSDYASVVAIRGNRSFLANVRYPSDVRTFDVSDPAHPIQSAAYTTPGEVQGMEVAGDTLYVTDSRAGLQILHFTLGGGTIAAPAASPRPQVDGDLGEWSGLNGTSLSAADASHAGGSQPTPAPADLSGSLRLAYAADTLYLAAEISDDAIVGNDSADPTDDDALELGIRAPAGDLHRVVLAADGRRTVDSAPASSITAITRTLPGGWAIEAAIPAASVGLPQLAAGQQYSFTFALDDDDVGQGSPAQTRLFWMGDSTAAGAADWGVLRLADWTLPFPVVTPTAVPTITPGPSPTSTATNTPTWSPPTPSRTPTASRTLTPSSTPTASDTPTTTPTRTPTATLTPTPTQTGTPGPPRGAIAGVAWFDANGNGRRDDGEPGMAGVLITITIHGVQIGAAETVENGAYGFERLPPGVYRLRQINPSWARFSSTADERNVLVVTEDVTVVDFGDWDGLRTYLPLLRREW